MAEMWLLLLLALGCPAWPTELAATPFPSLAPPVTLLVDGKQQTLVVCLVLDAAPPGGDNPIWFSAGNGSALDAFTYPPSQATDGTWTGLAQLSLPSEELAAWEPLFCHTGPGVGGQRQSTGPLQLSGGASTARTCFQEPVRGTPIQALRLGVLRLLFFKLVLFDVLLTCNRLCARTHRQLRRWRPPPKLRHRWVTLSPSDPVISGPRCSSSSRRLRTTLTPGRLPRTSLPPGTAQSNDPRIDTLSVSGGSFFIRQICTGRCRQLPRDVEL